MADKKEKTEPAEESELFGLLAQFDDPDSLVAACASARDAGYTKMDAYSPFPVHGIDPALGIRRTRLPFIVLAIGLSAVVLGLGMQWYANSADWAWPFPGYAFKIGGKPIFSLPANIPVTFEIIVLSSAFATFFGMWILNKLPMLSNPLHRVSRFKRATNDKFFLMLEKADEKFSDTGSRDLLGQWGAVAVEEVRQDLTDTKLPSWFPMACMLLGLVLLIPPVATFSVLQTTSRNPRLHVVPDMDWQHKFKTQTVGPLVDVPGQSGRQPLFFDGRSMRQPVEGSVLFDSGEAEPELFRGVRKDYEKTATVSRTSDVRTSLSRQDEEPNGEEPNGEEAATDPEAEPEEDLDQWVTEFPESIEVNEALLARGQQRFEIYCSVCHGYAGNGNGQVNQRALALAANGKAAWTAAKSLHEPDVKNPAQNPLGRIYDTITNGRRNMGPYAAQIPVEDRWAIVAWVKALQETGIEPPGAAEAEEDTAADETAAPETAEPEADAEESEPAEPAADESEESEPETAAEPAAEESDEAGDTNEEESDE